MAEQRRTGADADVGEGDVQGHLARRAGEQVLAPEHVGDAHQGVVDGVDQGVEGVAVATREREVGHVVAVEADPAAHEVVEGDLAVGHPEAGDRRPALGLERRDLLVGELAAEPVVAHVLRAGGLPARGDLVGRAVAAVGVAALAQAGQRVAVDLGALALPVRRVRTAHVGALVPVEAEPAEQVEEPVVGLLGVARRVGWRTPRGRLRHTLGQAKQPGRTERHHHHNQRCIDEEIVPFREPHPFRQEHGDQRANERTEEISAAADDHHQQQIERKAKSERIGLDELDQRSIERAGHAAELDPIAKAMSV